MHCCSSNITIDDGPLDFGDGRYNLETLYFNGSKIKCEEGPEEGMRRIIEAIANSPLQVSLKKIEVYECNIRKQDVAKLLKMYQIDHVKV